MDKVEKRKYPRVNIYYPISYACLDKNHGVLEQNMAVALNISQNGILIETSSIVLSKWIELISVDLNENIIELKGKIAFCKKVQSGKYRTDINFQASREQNVAFAKQLIKAHHYCKKEYRYRLPESDRLSL